ncbi:hypothetical protein KPL70_020800 [Citrus sinensis]|uniref:Uncharacterized protein n=1 Tax=Citrus clementina TaxID=85681 RepID=V4UME2_CITCL|nr:hypothetical protein CICLE_v10027104mg [Citrus x clementina]KAH9666816.1 hypothetical protein KPL70_020800 [Citrus sinensis]
MLHVLRMFSCGYLAEIPENRVLVGGSGFLVGELLSLKHLDVLSITLKGFSSVQKLMSSQQFQSCTKCLELIDCDDSKSFALAERDYLLLLMLHVLGIFSCGYLVEIPENSVLFGGSGFLVGLNVLSITLKGFSAVQKLTSPQKFQSCAQPLELIDCSDSKLFAFAELKHLEKLVKIKACHKLREVTWLVFAPYLEVIQIAKCMGIEVIISARKLGEVPEMMADLNPFAKLQYLGPRVLPKLKSIYWNQLPSLHKLPLGFNNAKESKTIIRGEEHWLNELQWEDKVTLNVLLPCFGSI